MLAVHKMLKIQVESKPISSKAPVEDGKKYFEITILLLEKGADPSIHKKDEQSPSELMLSMRELRPEDTARNEICQKMLKYVKKPNQTLNECQVVQLDQRYCRSECKP